MTFVLDDKRGDYQFANDLTGAAAKLTALYDSEEYPLWYGYVEEPAYRSLTTVRPITMFTCIGQIGLLDRPVVTDLFNAIPLDECIGHILDAIGWPEGARLLDEATTNVRFFWGSGEPAIELIQRLVITEGPGASFSIDGDGNFVFRSAAARWTDTRSTTPQAVIETDADSDFFMTAAVLTPKRRDLVNTAQMDVNIRAVVAAPSVIWESDQTLYVQPNSSRTIFVRAIDPSVNVITPVLGTDYTLQVGSLTSVSLDRTSGQVFGITYTAGPMSAWVTNLQLRGTRAVVLGQVQSTSRTDAEASIARHGVINWEPPYPPWSDIEWAKAQDLVDTVVARYQTGRPSIKLTVRANHNDAAMVAALGLRELDRITVNYTDIRVSGDYWIERIEHRVSVQRQHDVTFECEMAIDDDPTVTEEQDIAQTLISVGVGTFPALSGSANGSMS
jgi:hypothetical protein